jgi:hypothetical protein
MRAVKTALLPIALATAALLTPATAQALPRGFFGVVPQTALSAEDTSRMQAGGVETIRVPVSWGVVQPSPRSDYLWSQLDQVVALAARDRLEVLPFFYSTPRWLSRDWRRLPVDSGLQRRAWTAFLTAAVERYGRGGQFWAEHGPGSPDPVPARPIRAWQVWNEQNFFYFTKPASPGRYARLLAVSSRAIRRADRRAKVVIGGLFGDPGERPPRAMDAVDFLERLYRVRRVKGSFDAVALHPYAADTADLQALVEGVRRVLVRNRDRGAGLYVTELGWGSQHNPRVVSFEVGLRGQARQLRAAYRYLISNSRRLNLKQVDWFSWKDMPGACGFCDSVGLFRRGAKFRPKPAWHVFVAAAHGRLGR